MADTNEILDSDSKIELTSEEENIVAYVSKRELELQQEAQKVIEAEVQKEFGDSGFQIYKSMLEQFDSMGIECPECSKQELTPEEDEKDEEAFLEACDFYIESFQYDFDTSNIRTVLALCLNKEVKDITEQQVKTLATMLAYRGLMEGWLIDTILVHSEDPEEPDNGLKMMYQNYLEKKKNEN